MQFRYQRPCGPLLAALLLAAGTAGAQGVPATGAAAGNGGPALVAPANNSQDEFANAWKFYSGQ